MGYLSSGVDRFVEFLEKDRLSLFGIFLWVMFISMIRGYLEPVLHFGEFSFGLLINDTFTGISSFVGACLIISYFSGTDYKKVLNIASFGWIIFFTPPLFDFFLRGTLETGTWGFINVLDFSTFLNVLSPFFLLESGFSTGLLFQGIVIYTVLPVYVFWKSRSISSTTFFLVVASLFGFVQVAIPFFFYMMASPLVLELKLLPGAYQWYVFLLILWSGCVLMVNRRFGKEFLGFLKSPILITALTCVAGGLLSFPRFLNFWNLFLYTAVSAFLVLSFIIHKETGIAYRDIKTLLRSVFFHEPRGDRKFRYFELSLILQVISVVIAFGNSVLMNNPVFMALTLIVVLIINLQEIFRNSIGNRDFVYSLFIPVSFCLGYSVNYPNFTDIISRTWGALIILFILSLAIIHFSKK